MEKPSLNPEVAPFIPKNWNITAPFYVPTVNPNAVTPSSFFPGQTYGWPTSAYCGPRVAHRSERVQSRPDVVPRDLEANQTQRRSNQQRQRQASKFETKHAAATLHSQEKESRAVSSRDDPPSAATGSTSKLKKRKNKKKSCPETVVENVVDMGVEMKEVTILTPALSRQMSSTRAASEPKLNSTQKSKRADDEDFPAIGCTSNVTEDKVWPTRAGFRSYVDVTRSGPVKSVPRLGLTSRSNGNDEDEEWQDLSLATSDEQKGRSKKKAKETKAKPDKPKSRSKPQLLTLESLITSQMDNLQVNENQKKSAKTGSKVIMKKVVKPEVPRNKLDASAPSKRRGKERETPKARKPTTMKKVILKEKERKRVRLQASKSFLNRVKAEKESQAINEPVVETAEAQSGQFIKVEAQSGQFIKVEARSNWPIIVEAQSDMGQLVMEIEVEPDVDEVVRRIIHSRDYREYCTQSLNDEIDVTATALVTDLVKFQDRLFLKDPLKAKIRKRMSCGLKEVAKYVGIGKVKALIIAPDIEKIERNGVLDKTVESLVSSARERDVPIVFSLTRKQLAFICKKRGKASCVGIFSYDGSQDNFKHLLDLAEVARQEYADAFQEIKQSLLSMNRPDMLRLAEALANNVPKMYHIHKERLRRQTFFWRKRVPVKPLITPEAS